MVAVFGITGAGKSSTCNTMVGGRERAFEQSSSIMSVTKAVSFANSGPAALATVAAKAAVAVAACFTLLHIAVALAACSMPTIRPASGSTAIVVTRLSDVAGPVKIARRVPAWQRPATSHPMRPRPHAIYV